MSFAGSHDAKMSVPMSDIWEQYLPDAGIRMMIKYAFGGCQK
jgi:hypothetical protein